MRDRWLIRGHWKTTSPMHVGSGTIETHPRIHDQAGIESEVAAIVKDYRGLPCIPGTTIKGVLRAWGKKFFPPGKITPGEITKLDRLFGSSEIDNPNGEAGWVEFSAATMKELTESEIRRFSTNVPYWRDTTCSGISSHVCIDRKFGTARANKLFYEEFIPEGVIFPIEIGATRLDERGIELLLAILAKGASHKTHPYQFGANSADGWGRCTWSLESVTQSTRPLLQNTRAIGFANCTTESNLKGSFDPSSAPAHVELDVFLAFKGPFLVNDASRTRTRETPEAENDQLTNFTPLKRADGQFWLPSSSFRGALRQRAEFLLRSLDPNASGDPNKTLGEGPIKRLFGDTSRASKLTIEEFRWLKPCTTRKQDFVAIDRFTGGAAEGAKFDASYADSPIFRPRMILDLDGLELVDLALLALTLRDLKAGKITFGFGAAKGYGHVTAEVSAKFSQDSERRWNLPTGLLSGFTSEETNRWLKTVLEPIYKTPAASRSDAATETQVIASQEQATLGEINNIPNGRFIHPYYFLNLKDRKNIPARALDGKPSDLDDQPSPIGHEHYHADRYSGKIVVRLTTETQLLVCDEKFEEVANNHKIYHTRTDTGRPDGKPLIMPSSVRGMLRSAYEGITNSRFGVFPAEKGKGNARRQGYRLSAGEGLSVVPVRIEGGKARLMLGTNPRLPVKEGNRWVVPGRLLHAAWVFQYEPDQVDENVSGRDVSPWAVKIDNQPPNHRQAAWCWLEKIQHTDPYFSFWAVREASTDEAGLSENAPDFIPNFPKYHSLREPIKAQGFFCITNQNIDKKHDERFFFDSKGAHLEIESGDSFLNIDPEVISSYLNLIENYQLIHSHEIKKRHNDNIDADKYLGSAPGKTAWSRHVYCEEDLKFVDGTLCYAVVNHVGQQQRRIESLYPVMISRKLYPNSPFDLVPPKLRPATKIDELSPADRVFGWVSQNSEADPKGKQAAYRGHVRIGPVVCKTENSIESFSKHIPLAILGQPKPQQGRFYLQKSDGTAFGEGLSKEEAGYHLGNRVRGQKVYPHHQEFRPSNQASQISNWRGAEQTSQNRSIRDWIKPETIFEFDLHVENLSRIELGALVWLLNLPNGHFLRMGLGKPLGFGSVRVKMIPKESYLAEGAEWSRLLVSGETPAPGSVDIASMLEMKQKFEFAISRFNTTLLPSFLKAGAGFADNCTYYPRLQNQGIGDSEHFHWFVQNDNAGKHPLPDLISTDPALRLNPS